MKRRLIHYSKTPLAEVQSRPQGERMGGRGKPNGLWVSVEGEDDWAEWCRSENFGCLDCATEIVLRPNANVLRVVGTHALDEFHDEFSFVEYRYGGNLGVRTAINWKPVAERYDGIIIAPYVWQRRLDGQVSDWYHGWDCASGCIWNADAVQELRPLDLAEAA